MPSVDNRVVEMRFDNKDFESGVSTSLNTIDKLKSSLKFKDATAGLDAIDKAANSIDLSSVADAADTINHHFSALGIIGDQVLRRIGDTIYNLSGQMKGLIDSLTVDQVSAGWGKYAQKTEAVQTIMAATAKDFEDTEVQMAAVNEQLGKLSWFTDETSYNFVDMTSNIGKFTSNGQSLEKSVTAMQGISTWAAISGANAGEASRAMYNLSQALSVGAVKLMDWKSIENANMATVEFKQTALDTAVSVGKLTKVSDGLYRTMAGHEVTLETFNQNLSDEWFSSEVLMQSLDKYGGFTNALFEAMELVNDSVTTSEMLEYVEAFQNGTIDLGAAAEKTGLDAELLEEKLTSLASDEFELGRRAFKAAQEAKTFQEAIDATKDAVSSGWMESFEHIFGDYEHAKKLWTTVANELYDVFMIGTETRNELLGEWNADPRGYEQFWDAVSNVWEGLKGIGARIGNVWNSIFPAWTTETLLSATDKFHAFSETFRDTFAVIEDVADAVTGSVNSSIDGVSDETERAAGRYAKTNAVLDELVSRVWAGEFGNGDERRTALEELGYYYELVQNAVNESAGASYRYEIIEDDLNETISDTTEAMGDLAEEGTPENLSLSAKAAIALGKVLGALGSAIKLVISAAKTLGKYIFIPAFKGMVTLFQKGLVAISPFAEVFTNFVNQLQENNTFERNAKKIRMWFKGLTNLAKNYPNVQKLIDKFQQFRTWLGSIKETALEKLTNFFSDLAGTDLQLPSYYEAATWLDKMAGYASDFIDTIEEGWPQVKEFFQNIDFSDISSFATTASDAVVEFVQSLFTNEELVSTGEGWLDSIWQGITNKAASLDWGDVMESLLQLVTFGSLTAVTTGIMRLIWSVGTFAKKGASIGTSTLNILHGVGDVLRGFALDLKGAGLLMVASAIAILAGSIFLLSQIPTNTLTSVVSSLGSLILVISLLVFVMGKLGAFKKNADNVTNTIGDIGKVTLNFNFPNFAVTIIAIAAGVFLLVKAFKTLNDVINSNNMTTLQLTAIYLGGFAIILVTLAALFSKYGKDISFGSAVGIIAIAAGVLILSKALKSIAGIKGDVWSAVGALAIMLAGIVAIIAVSKDVKGSTLLGAGAGFIMLSVGMLIMAGALRMIYKIPWKKLLAATIAIAAIMAAFALITAQAKKASFGSLIGSMLLFAAMAASIRFLIVPSFLELQNLSFGQLLGTAIAFGAVMLAFAGAMALASKKANGNGMVSLLAMAGGIVLLSGALAVLATQDWPSVAASAVILGIFVAAMVGLGTLVGKYDFIASGLEAIGIAIGLIGAGVGMAGAGALAFSGAIDTLAASSDSARDAGEALADAIIGFFDRIMENGQSILEFISLIVMAVIGVIIAKKVAMADATVQLITEIAAALSKPGTLAILFGTLSVLLAALLDWLGVNLDSLVDSLVTLVLVLIDDISASLLRHSDDFRNAISNLLTALFTIILQTAASIFGPLFGWIVDAIGGKGTWDSWMSFLDQGFEEMATEIEQEASALKEQYDESVSNLGGSSEPEYTIPPPDLDAEVLEFQALDDAAEASSNAAEEAVESITSDQQMVDDATANAYSTITQGYSDLVSETGAASSEASMAAGDLLQQLIGAFVNGSDSVTLDGATIAGDMFTQLKDAFMSGDLDMDSIMASLTEGGGQGLLDNLDSILGGVDTVCDETENAFQEGFEINSPSHMTQRIGSGLDEGLALGIQNNTNLVEAPIQRLVNRCISSLDKMAKNFQKSGEQVIRGLIKGMDAQVPELNRRVEEIARTIKQTFDNVMEIESPSRVMYESGMYVALGVAAGMNGYNYAVADSAEGVAETAVNAFSDVVNRISDAIDGDFDMDPTIRPVLDLTNLQNGAAYANGLFGSVGVTPGLRYANSMAGSIAQMQRASSNAPRFESNSIVNAINELRGDVTTLNEEMKNMQVVMDSGQLVGSIGRRMDSYLGRTEQYRGRGI